jgi:hypothetical protein
MPKAAKAKKTTPRKTYVLPVKFNEEELPRLQAMEKIRGLRGGTLLKFYLKKDANEHGVP